MSATFVLAALTLGVDLVRPPASPDPATLAVPAAARAEAADLVGRLGSDDFAARDAASRDLRRMGRDALVALRAGARPGGDAEVRHRCSLLLPAATDADFRARLEVFLADADGKHRHDLPGWAEFRAMTGHDPHARDLFADLLRDEGSRTMLAGVAHDKPELARRVITRRQALAARLAGSEYGDPRAAPTLADAAGLVFCEAVLGEKYAPAEPRRVRGGGGSVSAYSLFARGQVSVGFTTDRHGPAVRKLLVAWFDSRETANGLSQAVQVATRLGMAEGTAAAARQLTAPGATPQLRAEAVLAIARLGGRDDAKLLVPLMSDESVLRLTPSYDIQVRDVALSAAVQMTGRDPAAFGFEARSSGYYGSSYSYTHWFPSADDRARAFEAWAKAEPALVPAAAGNEEKE